ncbi:MAG: enolase [Chloroflexi bacterium]|nr:enolase [Chloroflexota bacterium]
MPRIARIDTASYEVPLKGRLTWGDGHELRQLAHVLVRVELEDGAFGFAEATPRPSIYGETQASIRHIMGEHLAPICLGETIEGFSAIAALSARLARIKNNNTARGALDMALHQALARSRGERLSKYLGATRERILLSAIVSTGSQEAVMADVNALYQAGIRVFKVKIGREIETEIRTLERLIGQYPAAQFYVDANETLASDTAARLLQRLLELGVNHCEEALPVHRLKERRQLRRDCRMPIIADDSAFTAADLEREIASDTFDILNIKTARTGFSESRRMLERSVAARKAVMIGSQASSLLGCLHAAVFAGHQDVACANECSFYLKTEADLCAAPPIVAGWLALSAAEQSLEGMHEALSYSF